MRMIRTLFILSASLFTLPSGLRATPFSFSVMNEGLAADSTPATHTPDAQAGEDAIYEHGSHALDDHDWEEAIRNFRKLEGLHGSRSDAGLYWLSYAQEKLGERSAALDTILKLERRFPKSRWIDDARTLEVEIRQAAGQKIEPAHVSDEELKLMTLNNLMASQPEQVSAALDSLLKNPGTPARVKERALFILSQSDSPRSMTTMGQIARDSSNRDLQMHAVRFLGMMGKPGARELLASVYGSTNDLEIKRSILKSYMISGDRLHLLQLARGEANAGLRGEAVRQLGILGARSELADLYSSEQKLEVRKTIINAMFISGNAGKLADIARGEHVEELRMTAIKNLGLLGGEKTSSVLASLYQSEKSTSIKRVIVESLFLQGNSALLVQMARKEQDEELKHEMISKLSLMHGKEATDFLLEYVTR